MAHKVITISREYGSGGRLIAQQAAAALGIPYYDQSILNMVAEETGLSTDFVSQAEQQKTNSFLYNLYISTQRLPVNDQVFVAQSDVIRRVASEGPCIIVGRCADYVLRHQENAVSLFVHAPLEERIRRVREEYKVSAPDLGLYIMKQDKNRAAYYQHFTERQWGQAQNYHLSINSIIGVDRVVQLLAELVKE